tara:strand:- start:20651 stop:21670 length:1020 start_codon:yes stop_codon:yes gene_type:complete
MKKYIWKCESPNCGIEFSSQNPINCPNCNGSDILILKEDSAIKLNSKIAVLITVLVAALLVFIFWCNIFPNSECCNVAPPPDTFSVVFEDNYFKILGIDKQVYNYHVENLLSGKKIFSQKNKFYPCEDGDFIIKFDQENINLNGDKKIKNFKITTTSHEKACDKQLSIIGLDTDPSLCTYTIMTNMDDNIKLEVSIKEKNGFKKGKLVWTKLEVGDASYFYVRIKGTDQLAKKSITFIKACEILPISQPPPAPSDIVTSFDKYKSDISKNRQQFTELFKDQHIKPMVDFKGEELTFNDLIMKMKVTNINYGSDYVTKLQLLESGVITDNNNHITKLIIK